MALLTLALLSSAVPTYAQSAAAAAPAPAPATFTIDSLRPALANVQAVVSSLSVQRWKVPSATRANVQQDVSSMQRDLTATLPGLLVAAESSANNNPGMLSPSFAVFRNLDALYDVLLRVTETAALGNAEADAAGLESARADLETDRARLGVWLTQSIAAQDARLAQSPAATVHTAAPAASSSKVVVTDGPENTKPHKKKPVQTPQ